MSCKIDKYAIGDGLSGQACTGSSKRKVFVIGCAPCHHITDVMRGNWTNDDFWYESI